ncbi:hypothetical protein ACO0SA_004346 [Hanseniaspora valbyensis]
MLLRFRTNDGMVRLPCEKDETFITVIKRLLSKNEKQKDNIDLDSIIVDFNNTHLELKLISDDSINDLGFQHGDIVNINYKLKENPVELLKSAINTDNNNSNDGNANLTESIKGLNLSKISQVSNLKELPVDIVLESQDGLIKRYPNPLLCRHGDKGMCEHCSPIPCYDPKFQEERNFKHLSFHSYLKKLKDSQFNNHSAYVPKPLEQPSFKITKKPSCVHEAWPKGICSKCQPSAITLQQQDFRMVDHVEFLDSEIINSFVDSWRNTGAQRFGILLGSYEEYSSVIDDKDMTQIPPLGIKCQVQQIYEPFQSDEYDGLTFKFDKTCEELKNIVKKFAIIDNLYPVGFVFTDLTDSGKKDGSVLCKRHQDSYFLTNIEIIQAAKWQNLFPNICKDSEEGYFGSKFVTCCISGNLNNEIDISTYQVSVNGEALVDADFISGSTDPSMLYLKETDNTRYVPEVFFMKTNEYGLKVKENAKPAFPVEYLLVTLTHGFSKQDNNNNNSDDANVNKKINSRKLFLTNNTSFPIENREHMGYKQDHYELKTYLADLIYGDDLIKLREKLSNFHLLNYINSLDILSKSEWEILIKASCVNMSENDDFSPYLLQLLQSPGWQTLVMILQDSI